MVGERSTVVEGVVVLMEDEDSMLKETSAFMWLSDDERLTLKQRFTFRLLAVY